MLPKIVSIPLALLLIYLTLGLTWYEVRGFYQINDNSIIIAGEAADKILPKSARVVAPYGGSTSFLYYINRPGFAYIPGPIDEVIDKYNINYYVAVSYDEDTKNIMKKYKVIEQTPKYVIVDLSQK